MIRLVLVPLFELLVLCAFATPVVLRIVPDEWRCWWPVIVLPAGLATSVAVLQPISWFVPMNDAALPALGAVAAVDLALVVRGHRLVRPRRAALLVVGIASLSGFLAYLPSLASGYGRPPGILNEDAVYYMSIDTWMVHHAWRDAPPASADDGFYAPAEQTHLLHIRVGVDLVNTETSALLRVDPLKTAPATSAVLAMGLACAVALLVVSWGASSWIAAIGALLAASRPEFVRLALDSYVAQLAGITMAILSVVFVFDAVRKGGKRRIAMAALFAAALPAFYVEYVPFLVAAIVVFVVALVSTARPVNFREPLARLATIAALAFVVNPIAVLQGARSLADLKDLQGESIVPFYGWARDVALTLGPFSVTHVADGAVLIVACIAAVVALVSVCWRRGPERLAAAAIALGLGALILKEAVVTPYSYGVTKVLSLIAPFGAAAIASALSLRGRAPKVVAGAVCVALLAVNTPAIVYIERQGLTYENGMTDEDRLLLEQLPATVPDAHDGVAFEGFGFPNGPNARLYFGVYMLRFRDGIPVTYLPYGYYAFYTKDTSRPDATGRGDYRYVVSYGPSIAHDDKVVTIGPYDVYQRRAVDVLLGTGWGPLVASPDGPARVAESSAGLLVAATDRTQVRLVLAVRSSDALTPISVRVDDHAIALTTAVSSNVTTITTDGFAVDAGITRLEVARDVTDSPGPADVSLLSVRAEPAG